MDIPQKPVSLEELKKLRKPVKNFYKAHKEKLSPMEQIAVFIANKIGSFGFFIVLATWTTLWLSWNIFAPVELKFDPAPAFVIWLFISNMVQLFLLPMILIAQNLQDKIFQERALADYEINMKAEREIEAAMENLEYQNEMLIKILQKIEKEK